MLENLDAQNVIDQEEVLRPIRELSGLIPVRMLLAGTFRTDAVRE